MEMNITQVVEYRKKIGMEKITDPAGRQLLEAHFYESETDDSDNGEEQIRTRIEALFEMAAK